MGELLVVRIIFGLPHVANESYVYLRINLRIEFKINCLFKKTLIDFKKGFKELPRTVL